MFVIYIKGSNNMPHFYYLLNQFVMVHTVNLFNIHRVSILISIIVSARKYLHTLIFTGTSVLPNALIRLFRFIGLAPTTNGAFPVAHTSDFWYHREPYRYRYGKPPKYRFRMRIEIWRSIIRLRSARVR